MLRACIDNPNNKVLYLTTRTTKSIRQVFNVFDLVLKHKSNHFNYHSACGQSHCRIKNQQKNMNSLILFPNALKNSLSNSLSQTKKINKHSCSETLWQWFSFSLLLHHPTIFCSMSSRVSIISLWLFMIGTKHLLCFQDIASECKPRRKQIIQAQVLFVFWQQYPCLHLFHV